MHGSGVAMAMPGELLCVTLVARAQETEYAVSPVTPLLSTAIEENGWVCGTLPGWQGPSATHLGVRQLSSIDCSGVLRSVWLPQA